MVRTLPSDVLPESNAPAPPRASRRTRRRRNARVSTRTERGTQSDRGSDGTGQDPRTSVLDIQRRKSLIRDRKGLDLMPATLRIFFPNPSPPAFPNIVLSKTDKRLQHFGTRTDREVDFDRGNGMTPDPRTDGREIVRTEPGTQSAGTSPTMIRPGRVTRPEASTKDRSHQASDPSDIQVQATPQEKSTQPRTGVPDTAS